jgi:glycosyltransferase involved in cell wall biosynthesis
MANTETVVIHNGIDLQCFCPQEGESARVALNLPTDKFLIAFGAASLSDTRKGLQLLHQALEIFAARVGREHCELVVFGSGAWKGPSLSIPMRSFGAISDDRRLALIYAACDVFCAPSREENLATTAIEALACGTPVVSFRVGGFGDIVDHLKCGFLANPFEAEDLADGLHYVYSNGSSGQDLRAAARARAEGLFDGKTIAARHLELYRSLV